MPEVNLDDTIAAIATPLGVGAIGIVRLSGKDSISITSRMFRSKSAVQLDQTKSHTVHFGHICDEKGSIVDEVLVTVFRKPRSYTTEDMVEIGTHGGPHVVTTILNLALSLGARQAEPGEFTRRAFLNGRIDLAQAEAVLDLIRAKNTRSLEIALRQLAGKLSEEIKSIKDQLMLLYANLEAYLDFPDEHLEVYSNKEFQDRFQNTIDYLKRLLATFSKSQIMREGALTVIVGRPNVGKSSLLNALLERDRALVSEIPGTTRDVLEEAISLNGLSVRLVDTAGLAASSNPLDRAAMERTRQFLRDGDLFLWILDASEGLLAEDRAVLNELKGKKVISVVNKIDLTVKKDFSALEKLVPSEIISFVSAKTGEGIEVLEQKIATSILEADFNSESNVITRLRHKRALEQSLDWLQKSQSSFLQGESLEFIAHDLKAALDALRELVGEVYSEDLLDVIFGEFCIGK